MGGCLQVDSLPDIVLAQNSESGGGIQGLVVAPPGVLRHPHLVMVVVLCNLLRRSLLIQLYEKGPSPVPFAVATDGPLLLMK